MFHVASFWSITSGTVAPPGPAPRSRLVTFPTWHQATLRTTQDTDDTIAAIEVPVGYTVGVRFVIVARCTDLYVDEGLFAEGEGGWINIGGIATTLGSDIRIHTNTYSWNVQFTQFGDSIYILVNGDPYVNVSWMIRWAVDQVEEV